MGWKLKQVVAAMRSDGAATGVARKLGLEGEGCGMNPANKLGSSCVGRLLRQDMMRPVGPDGHRPYANAFPAGVVLTKKARSMGLYYSSGSRFSALMTLRESAGLLTKSSGTRTKVSSHASILIVYSLVYCFWHTSRYALSLLPPSCLTRRPRMTPKLRLNMSC